MNGPHPPCRVRTQVPATVSSEYWTVRGARLPGCSWRPDGSRRRCGRRPLRVPEGADQFGGGAGITDEAEPVRRASPDVRVRVRKTLLHQPDNPEAPDASQNVEGGDTGAMRQRLVGRQELVHRLDPDIDQD